MTAIACSPFAYDRVAHGVATWGLWGLFTLSETVVKPRLLRPHDTGPTVDLPLWCWDDRWQGRASRLWRRTSDITCAASVLLPLAVSASGGLAGGCKNTVAAVGDDALLAAEACMAVNVVTTLFKLATRRHRPPAIESETPNIEYLLSFPSGHAATATCAATFATVAAALRYQDTQTLALVGTVGAMLSGLTAMGRVLGSMHYFSDVMGGAFLGSTVGFLIPWLARRSACAL